MSLVEEKKKKIKDPDSAELELKMVKDINIMPDEVKDRFKAMKVLYDQVNVIDEEEDELYRKLELKYEKLYKEVYAKRALLIKGDPSAIDKELLEKFEERQKVMIDADFAELEVPVCEVKDIQNIPFGVNNFWLKAMLANHELGHAIFEILSYLQDITLDLHEVGYGFQLTFHFEKNHYFKETTLHKSFHMSQQNEVDNCVGTPITWNAGCDVT